MKYLLTMSLIAIAISTYCQQGSFYDAKEGYVILEAEDIPHSANWTLLNERNGFTGSGYLKWVGGKQGSGEDQKIDKTGALQGNKSDWLIIPVKIHHPGKYYVNLRNTHDFKDGDNDVWIHIVDYPLPVRRVGDHGVETFQWLTWGVEHVTFDIKEPGIYQFYIAGRSDKFAVDRVAIYTAESPVKILHKEFPVSPLNGK